MFYWSSFEIEEMKWTTFDFYFANINLHGLAFSNILEGFMTKVHSCVEISYPKSRPESTRKCGKT